jgi:putative redox protein
VPDAKPPISAELIWSDRLCFGGSSGQSTIVIDGDGEVGPSPMQLAAFAVAGCMAVDVVSILTRGRHVLTGLRVSLVGGRAPEPPRHYTTLTLHFIVEGVVPAEAVERAVSLSREKYCSVWHSFRRDISFTTTFELHP